MQQLQFETINEITPGFIFDAFYQQSVTVYDYVYFIVWENPFDDGGNSAYNIYIFDMNTEHWLNTANIQPSPKTCTDDGSGCLSTNNTHLLCFNH